MANGSENGVRRFIDLKVSVGNLLTLVSMLLGLFTLWDSLGDRVVQLETIQNNQQSMISDIRTLHRSDLIAVRTNVDKALMVVREDVDKIEERAGAVREDLSGIKATLSHNSAQLLRILRAVEQRPQ